MPAYILRYAGTDWLAGFYAADDEDDLFDLIDEETSPGDYEYAEVEFGFGMEFRRGIGPIDFTIGKEKDPSNRLAEASFIYMTMELSSILGSGDDNLRWRRIHQD